MISEILIHRLPITTVAIAMYNTIRVSSCLCKGTAKEPLFSKNLSSMAEAFLLKGIFVLMGIA